LARRLCLGHDATGPGHDEAEDVGKIVAGIRKQSHRIGPESEDHLRDDETEIERYADRERLPEARWSMAVPMAM
jgi:hypothetical protein